MLAIRLTRIGSKKRPSYRIIVCEKRSKRDGIYVEKLGYYNPLTEPATLSLDKVRFDYWIEKGAQPSDVIKRIVLGVKGTKKRKPKKEAPEAPEAVAPRPQDDQPLVDATAVEPAEATESSELAETTVESETPAEAPAAEESEATESRPEDDQPLADVEEAK